MPTLHTLPTLPTLHTLSIQPILSTFSFFRPCLPSLSFLPRLPCLTSLSSLPCFPCHPFLICVTSLLCPSNLPCLSSLPSSSSLSHLVSPGSRQTKHLADPALGLLSRWVSGRVSGLFIKQIGRVIKLTALTVVLLWRETRRASRQPDGPALRHEQTKLVHFNRKHNTAGAHSRF